MPVEVLVIPPLAVQQKTSFTQVAEITLYRAASDAVLVRQLRDRSAVPAGLERTQNVELSDDLSHDLCDAVVHRSESGRPHSSCVFIELAGV